MNEYKYANPHEWLQAYIDRQHDLERADWWRNLVMTLANKLDGDQIQGLFQQEMVEDGYFDKDE